MGKDKKETRYEALRLSGPRLRPCVYPPHPPSTLFLLLRIRFNNFISRPDDYDLLRRLLVEGYAESEEAIKQQLMQDEQG
ncbi:hypothetical protein ACFW1Q_21020, partial [Serratia bockelmannii]